MKKWYKSHLDQLKAADKKNTGKKTSSHSFDAQKLSVVNRVFPNPVAVGKLKRSKTDSR